MGLDVYSDPMLRALTVGREEMAAPVVDYQGWEWVGGNLPCGAVSWAERDGIEEELSRFLGGRVFAGPARTHYVIHDVHGDAGALLRSLVASGGVAKTGPYDADLELTPAGRDAVFVMGGDMLGTGPSNLRVLGVLEALRAVGANVQIVAGNQELRLLSGLGHLGDRRVANAHLFVRLGRMGVRLVQEILASPDFTVDGDRFATGLDDVAALARMIPDEAWYEAFPREVACRIPRRQIGKELLRIREKSAEFRRGLREAGIAPARALTAARFARHLVREGRFAWMLDRMHIAMRAGAYLFVHAGVGDGAAAVLRYDGVDGLNARFRAALSRGDELRMYHGPLGNCSRTRYRLRDEPLTAEGIANLRAAGVYVLVHGHGEFGRGISARVQRGVVDIAMDVVLNANARASEGIDGPGAAVLTIRNDGQLWASSVDFSAVKVLDLPRYAGLSIRS